MERSKVKITVVKKLSTEDIYGGKLPDAIEDMETECPLFTEVKEFIVDEVGNMPQGFCSWAWADIQRDVTHLRFQGDFPWMKVKGVTYACCTDGLRPVFFKLERI